MSKYQINWLTVKKPDWYELSLIDESGAKLLNVSINEIDKKTGKQAWPDWKNIAAGHTIEGKLWQSPKGKTYLFPVQEDENSNGMVVHAPQGAQGHSGGYNKVGQINQTMETKRRNIEYAMTQKENAIKESSTFRDATLLTVAELGTGAGDEQIRETWLRWRAFLLKNWAVNEPF